MKFRLALLMAVALAAAIPRASGAPSHRLDVRLVKYGEILFIEVRNISDEEVPITALSVAGGRNSDLSLYLYDPRRKHLQVNYSTSFPSLVAPRQVPTPLAPGKVRSLHALRAQIERYFARVPPCYYLVAAYRDRSGGQVASAVSKAVRVCKPVRRANEVPPPPDVGDVGTFHGCTRLPTRGLSRYDQCVVDKLKAEACTPAVDCVLTCMASPQGVEV